MSRFYGWTGQAARRSDERWDAPARPRPSVGVRRGPAGRAVPARTKIPPVKASALTAAWEYVEWAVRQGRSVESILQDAGVPAPPTSTIADAVATLAREWEALQEPGREQAERVKLDRLSRLRDGATPVTPIAEAVCAEMAVDPDELFSPSRSRPVVAARREVLVRALVLTRHSLLDIAGWLGLDRSTAIYHRSAALKAGRIAAAEQAAQGLAAHKLESATPAEIRAAAALLGRRMVGGGQA